MMAFSIKIQYFKKSCGGSSVESNSIPLWHENFFSAEKSRSESF